MKTKTDTVSNTVIIINVLSLTIRLNVFTKSFIHQNTSFKPQYLVITCLLMNNTMSFCIS